MPPLMWGPEQKEKWWKEFHRGEGSVIKRLETKCGRTYLTFVTPSGEKYDSWKKAQEYTRLPKQVVKAEMHMDGDQNANLVNPQIAQNSKDGQNPNLVEPQIAKNSKEGQNTNLVGPQRAKEDGQNANVVKPHIAQNDLGFSRRNWAERREFREWFWRKKGGFVVKREYPHKNGPPYAGRWETTYIFPEGTSARTFRSWKGCVEFLGFDPELSIATTSWERRRYEEDHGLPPIEVFSRINNDTTKTKRMRGQLWVLPHSTAAAVAPTSNSATNYPELDSHNVVASVQPVTVGPINLTDPKYVHGQHPKLNGQPKESTDSSTVHVVRCTLGSKRGLEDEENHGHENLQSKRCNRRSSNGNGELKLQNLGEDKELQDKLGPEKCVKNVQSFVPVPLQNNAIRSVSGNKVETSDVKRARRRRRRRLVKLLGTTTEERSEEAKDTSDEDLSRDEVHPPEHPPVIKQMSPESSTMAAPPTGRLTGVNGTSKDNGIHASERKDHDQKLMNCSGKNVVTLYEESNHGEQKDQDEGPSLVSVDDETLQKGLINLLYADHLKQPSRHSNSNLIGQMYAEFIERSFARSQNNKPALLDVALTRRKPISHSLPPFPTERRSERIKYRLGQKQPKI